MSRRAAEERRRGELAAALQELIERAEVCTRTTRDEARYEETRAALNVARARATFLLPPEDSEIAWVLQMACSTLMSEPNGRMHDLSLILISQLMPEWYRGSMTAKQVRKMFQDTLRVRPVDQS